jgi:hexokinase
MIGGRYLGELVRLICLDVLSPQVPEKLATPYALDTKLCSRVEAAGDDEEVLELLKDYFDTDGDDGHDDGVRWPWDATSAATFRRVAVAVSTRAAALLAAATVGLLCLNDELDAGSPDGGGEVVVCYAGTVLERYPTFQERCEAFMNGIVKSWRDAGGKEGRTVRLVEARDGGLLGAAVLAGMVKGGRT